MNELLKVEVNERQEQTVSGRELHMFLEIETPYKKWFDRMCEYGFAENMDFVTVGQKCPIANGGYQERTDHIMKIDMAKELCMLARNEKGKQARHYFLEVERDWNSPEKVMARALKLAEAKLAEVKLFAEHQAKMLEEAKPKVEFYNEVTESDDTMDMQTVAKVLNYKNIGRNKLFEILRANRILRYNNQPFQKYIDMGWFKQVETKWTAANGDIRINVKTVVFQKGLDGIRKILRKEYSYE